jgi:xylulokinase
MVLGFDLGLSGARAAVMSEQGEIVATSTRQPVATLKAFGRAEQDPRDWLAAIGQAGREVVAKVDASAIRAIGVSAFGPAPVVVDDALDPLFPSLLFALDTRAESQRSRLGTQLGLGPDRLNHDHAIPKLLWWQESAPDRWSQAAWALDATGFIVSRLTGIPTMDEITALDYSLADFECPLAIPAPTPPTSIAGPLNPEWAATLGLRPDVDVLTGTYDSYADVAGLGAKAIGDAALVLGTTLIIGVAAAAAPENLRGLVSSPYLGDGILVGGWTSTGCSAMTWVRQLLGAQDTFDDDLETAAQHLVPGDGGILFLPYLAGERSPVHDPGARGVLLGLTSETTREQIYRAVVDGLALSVLDHRVRLAEIGIFAGSWRAGGGGSQSHLLVQAICDALGDRVEVASQPSAPVGPCRIALTSLGFDPPVSFSRCHAPDPNRTETFERLYPIYRSLYEATSGQMHSLAGIGRAEGVQS